MALLFIDKVTTNRAAFEAEVRKYSQMLGINPDWLMIVMYMESGLNPKAYNANGGASGLIQFMPATAEGLGITTAALRELTNVQQMYYVYKYFKPAAGKLKSVFDLYLYTFFPVAVGKPTTYILETSKLSAATIAKANPIIDINKDLKITVGEFYQYVDNFLKKKGLK
jgi:hypothetical protein